MTNTSLVLLMSRDFRDCINYEISQSARGSCNASENRRIGSVMAFVPAPPALMRPTKRALPRRTRATYTVRVPAAPLRGVHLRVRAVVAASAEAAAAEGEFRLGAGVRARTVVHVCKSGTLCTASVKHAGVPFGSFVDYVLDADGRPVFLLAKNATHSKNLAEESRCSLYCQPTSRSGQHGSRATLVGRIRSLPEEALEDVRDAFVEVHPHAADALAYPELFAFWRLEVEDVFFVGGYGVKSQWVDAAEFVSGEPDPLCFDAPEIVSGVNKNRVEDLKRLCKVFLDVKDPSSCTMTSLDRLGFDLRVRDGTGEIREYRVAFRETVGNRFDAQSALVKAFQEAWERENGFNEMWSGEDARPTVLYYAPA